MIVIIVILLSFFPFYSIQGDCAFISGGGCVNGLCKYCAMCITDDCILSTPYSTTGDNVNSTCAVTHQKYGYEFYNYCLSSGDDDDGDDCSTSTVCHHYEQSNATDAMHVWDNLTCDQDSCFLVNTPRYINTTSISNTTQPVTGSGSDGNEHVQDHVEDNKRSSTIIAVVIVCTVISFCLLALSVRILFYKTKYWPTINKYFCCNFWPRNNNETIDSSVPSSGPPSFRSEMVIRSNNSDLPGYTGREVSPPKYEEAIVTQIRGARYHHNMDYHQPSSSTQAVWVPVYARPGSFVQHDWATQTIRHQTLPN
ncbi:hypothetical protein INT47_001645 [Mucor saturninus]|uniref:Uncharacterized protein n=1 Tax=Mucor saturninus TaxID=64648 RepID=A0A8H7V6T4_9FUNG|nr:hypothetical protein INT47_001645 [Mucor saturninus]